MTWSRVGRRALVVALSLFLASSAAGASSQIPAERIETFEEMRQPTRLKSGELVGYGLGWGVFVDDTWYGEREVLHGGGTPKVSGMLYLLPERGFAVTLLMNLEDRPERVELCAEIARLLLRLGQGDE